MNFRFLEKESVVRIHRLVLEAHGGQDGIRDEGLLEAALAMPEATFGGELLHATLEAATAAYLFHLCQNHPFLDGNKRVAFLAAYSFAHANGRLLEFPDEQAEEIVLAVASGKMSKQTLTGLIREALIPRQP